LLLVHLAKLQEIFEYIQTLTADDRLKNYFGFYFISYYYGNFLHFAINNTKFSCVSTGIFESYLGTILDIMGDFATQSGNRMSLESFQAFVAETEIFSAHDSNTLTGGIHYDIF
jgi:hypothetical protein